MENEISIQKMFPTENSFSGVNLSIRDYSTDGKVNLKCDIFKKELRLSLSCYN